MMYFPHALAADVAPAADARWMTVVLRGDGNPTALVEPLRALLASLDRDQPLGAIQTMTSIVNDEFVWLIANVLWERRPSADRDFQ